jgi:hypothetical protein
LKRLDFHTLKKSIVMVDESSGVSSSDGPKSDISMINLDNNYETESTETGEESIDEEMTEGTHGKGVVVVVCEVVDVVRK